MKNLCIYDNICIYDIRSILEFFKKINSAKITFKLQYNYKRLLQYYVNL